MTPSGDRISSPYEISPRHYDYRTSIELMWAAALRVSTIGRVGRRERVALAEDELKEVLKRRVVPTVTGCDHG